MTLAPIALDLATVSSSLSAVDDDELDSATSGCAVERLDDALGLVARRNDDGDVRFDTVLARRASSACDQTGRSSGRSTSWERVRAGGRSVPGATGCIL